MLQQSQAPAIDWLRCLQAVFYPLHLTADDHVLLHNLPYIVHMSPIIGKWLNKHELSTRYCKWHGTPTFMQMHGDFPFLNVCCHSSQRSATNVHGPEFAAHLDARPRLQIFWDGEEFISSSGKHRRGEWTQSIFKKAMNCIVRVTSFFWDSSPGSSSLETLCAGNWERVWLGSCSPSQWKSSTQRGEERSSET